jgi:hypothetical protein
MKPDWRSRTPRSFGISHQAAMYGRHGSQCQSECGSTCLNYCSTPFKNKDIRRLRAELLKTEAHLTRSAHRLVQERNTKAARDNVGLASPSMTATRFSPISVTSTMTDFYSTSTPANWPQNSTPLQTSASTPSSSEQQQPSHGPPDRASQSPLNTATGFTQNSDAGPLSHSQRREGTTGHLLSTQETIMNSPPEEGSPPPTPEPHCDHQPSQIHQSLPWDQSEARVPPSVPAPLHSQMTYQPRRDPNRPGCPPQGNTDHLVLLTDKVHHGRLPDDYQLTSALVPIKLKPDDMTDILPPLPGRWTGLLSSTRGTICYESRQPSSAILWEGHCDSK